MKISKAVEILETKLEKFSKNILVDKDFHMGICEKCKSPIYFCGFFGNGTPKIVGARGYCKCNPTWEFDLENAFGKSRRIYGESSYTDDQR